MTRFARAKGSKASNERVPEEATSWAEMKEQLRQKQDEQDSVSKRLKVEEERNENYNAFLNDLKNEQNSITSWADIEVDDASVQNIGQVANGRNVVNTKSLKKKNPKFKKLRKIDVLVSDENTDGDCAVDTNTKRVAVGTLKRKNHVLEKNENNKAGLIHNVVKNSVRVKDAERFGVSQWGRLGRGSPEYEIESTMKVQSRRSENTLNREQTPQCYRCRKPGHKLANCPMPEGGIQVTKNGSGADICLKCGSTKHKHFQCKAEHGDQFKFAICFVCNEAGHISRQCPNNPNGLYPNGGSCKMCGDLTHLRKDCPIYQAKQGKANSKISVGVLDQSNPDDFSDKSKVVSVSNKNKSKKVIKF